MNQSLPSHATLAAEELPRRKFTVAEIDAMVAAGILEEDERVELIEGELVPMSAKGSRHEALKIALNRRWGRLCPDSCNFAQETTLRLSVDTYLEPDFIVYPRAIPVKDISAANILLAV